MKLLVLSVAALLQQEHESGAPADPGGVSFADVTLYPAATLPHPAPLGTVTPRAPAALLGALEDVDPEYERPLRPLARLRALGRNALEDLEDLTWALPTARAAYVRALVACAGVITAQTLAPNAALPPVACALAARVEGWRAAHELLMTTGSVVGIYGAADVLTQTLEQKRGPPRVRRGVVQTGVDISVSRTLRSAVTSGFVSGFLAFFYYRVLDRVLLGQGAAAAILLSNTVDLMVYRPIKYMIYIAMQALLRGEPEEILDEIRYKMPEIWKQQLRYWAVANLLKFSLVPVKMRALVSSLMGIPFSMYLSWIANRDCSIDDDACDIEAVLMRNQWEQEDPDEPLSPELAAVDAGIEEAFEERSTADPS